MGVKVSVYVPILSDELFPKIYRRFSELGMNLAFHPAFTLQSVPAPTIVSSRFSVHDDVGMAQYQNVQMLSEFELTMKEFKYGAPLSVDPAVNEKLKWCRFVVTVRMHGAHTNAFRVGMFFAAILAEAADGIVYSPKSDAYLAPEIALRQFSNEIATYEKGLAAEDWRVTSFNSW